MMLLLPGNAKALLEHLQGDQHNYGWLLTPRRTMTISGLFGFKYGVDNECFTLGYNFDDARFRRALERIAAIHGQSDCLFVTAPDVIGDARATIAQFDLWMPVIRSIGFPVALAGQDGLENCDIPWDDMDALFVGGTTAWKLSRIAADLIREAKERGKWTHIGRVNSTKRASRLLEHPDSVDGTAWAKHPAYYSLQWRRWIQSGKPSFVGDMF